jgi:hypothetical protein
MTKTTVALVITIIVLGTVAIEVAAGIPIGGRSSTGGRTLWEAVGR